MRKVFLLKTVFLVTVLVAVLAAIIATTRAGFGDAATEAAQTGTFFKQFVIGGGPIVWFVLLPMSLVMVYLAAEYCLTIRAKKLLPAGIGGTIVKIIQQFGPGQLESRVADRGDFISTAVVRAVGRNKGDWFRMRNALFESLQEQGLGLLRKIEWINMIGNVSPMVGLFGTVFGMIKLFNAIVMAGGQPQPAQLAEGISVALVTTFWGLFIAIPALAIHGVFQNRIESLLSEAVVEVENILPGIKLGLAKQSTAKTPKQRQPIQEIRSKPSGTIRQSSVPLR